MTEYPVHSAGGPAHPAATPAEFAELLPATRRALHHRLATVQRERRVPSVVAAVVRDGRPVWQAGRGEMAGAEPDAGVAYRIGSLTKSLVAVTVLRARDEGLLDLGDRLDAHLADVPVAGDVTVAQLLSHGAGLAAEARGPWWERTPGELRPRLADVFGPEPRPHPPGRTHHYSNPGYALLGALTARVRGTDDWFGVLRDTVLTPLDMADTTLLPRAPHADGWAVHPHADVVQPEPAVDTGRMAPAGQLWSTVADLGRFAAFLTAGDDRVLGADSLAEMRRAAVPPADDGWQTGYGLGLQLLRRGGRTLAGHSGSMPGFVAALWTSPADRLATVVVANATGGLRATELAAELLELVAEAEPAFPEPWRPARGVPTELLELTGPWYWGSAAQELRVREDRLELGPPGGGPGAGFRAAPDGDGWLALDGYFAGERLRAVRDADGRVTHLDLGTFVFTRRPYDPTAPVPGGTDPDGWR